MSRTRFARDKKKRKRRSDYKHRIKPRFFFRKPKGNKDSILLWPWECRPMSVEGYRHWDYRVRNRMAKEVKIPLKNSVVRVSINEIDTTDKFIDTWVNLLLREGDFLIMCFTNKKNKYHCCPVPIARIRIKRNEYGLYGIMIKSVRLFRYKWFFKD